MDPYPALYFPELNQLVPLARFEEGPCVVGRDPESSIPIPDVTCSRRQFRVVRDNGGFNLEAISQNVPTLRNGAPVTSPSKLSHDDKITCGSTTVVFLERDGRAAAPRATQAGSPQFGPVPTRPTPSGPTPSGPAPVQSAPAKAGPFPTGPAAAGPTPTAPAPAGPTPAEQAAAVRARFAPRQAAPPPMPPPDLAPNNAKATVVGNFRAEMEALVRPTGEIPLNRNAVIGRAPGPGGITLDHPRVSRAHAEVRVQDGKVFLRDLGSSNGTFLNGERITGHRELRVRDRIDVGPYSFQFTGAGLVQSSREGNLRVVARGLSRTVRSHADGRALRILDDVTIVVEPGEFVCILGSSGSGKSTLMQALSARAPADQGRVFLNEISLYDNFQTVKQSIALVPQKDVLHEDLTLEECIGFTAKLRLPPDSGADGLRNAVRQAIARVDLTHRSTTPIKYLSGGQKKRAALANETVSKPELLFLDEVTSGLDEGTDWEMMRLFRKMADDGMTVICVTHTVANVEDFCHKIIIMTQPGVLAYYGPPAGAKKYFEVEKLGDIYRRLAETSGEEWRDRYLASDEYRRYVHQPLAAAPRDITTPARPADQGGRAQDTLPEIQRQFAILTNRFSKLLAADRKTVGIALAQSALIGVFLVMVFGTVAATDPKQFPLIFFLGISCFWCGCNNASKEIVKERFIYSMERDVNLSIASYILSKTIILGIFGILQVGLLFGIVYEFGTIPGDLLSQFLNMGVAVVAGTATGLFISALARTEDQASTMVPIALIPQILLAGIIVPDLPRIPDLIARVAISGFWVYRSMRSVLTKELPKAHDALMVLAVHTVVLLVAAAVLLAVRDSRGVYGKAVNQRLKQKT